MTVVDGPTYAAISPSEPTAVIRWPVIASASASGVPSSTVTIFPPVSTRSAGSTCGAQAKDQDPEEWRPCSYVSDTGTTHDVLRQNW